MKGRKNGCPTNIRDWSIFIQDKTLKLRPVNPVPCCQNLVIVLAPGPGFHFICPFH